MNDFSTRLVAWQKVHGRHGLPWQNTTDPYAIWVSEIMLQQTQVAAVIGYYSKFMRRFPDIATLANATQDEVLQHWSGLGYYSRARNLHNAATTIVDMHGGEFPQAVRVSPAVPGLPSRSEPVRARSRQGQPPRGFLRGVRGVADAPSASAPGAFPGAAAPPGRLNGGGLRASGAAGRARAFSG